MSKTFVFATSSSRLAADLIIIRLKRVGLAMDKISALFPSQFRPNTALCWLGSRLTSAGWRDQDTALSIAGPLGRYFTGKSAKRGLADRLEATGLAEESSRQLEEKIRQGQILICIQADSDEEVSKAWHVCYQTDSDSLFVTSGQETVTVQAFPRRFRFRSHPPARALASLAFGFAANPA
jgi:hypothetical protein